MVFIGPDGQAIIHGMDLAQYMCSSAVESRHLTSRPLPPNRRFLIPRTPNARPYSKPPEFFDNPSVGAAYGAHGGAAPPHRGKPPRRPGEEAQAPRRGVRSSRGWHLHRVEARQMPKNCRSRWHHHFPLTRNHRRRVDACQVPISRPTPASAASPSSSSADSASATCEVPDCPGGVQPRRVLGGCGAGGWCDLPWGGRVPWHRRGLPHFGFGIIQSLL